jgi:sec-independent protein translocase protein TatA
MRIGPTQILILVLIVLILFGAKRLPDVASSVGKSLKIFKKEVTELREGDSAAPPVSTTTPPATHTTVPADQMGGGLPTGHDVPVPPGGSTPPLTYPPDADPRR